MSHSCRTTCYRTKKDEENSECRHQFPQKERGKTELYIKPVVGKNGKERDFIYCMCERKEHQKNLNASCRPLLEVCRTNQDFKLLVDSESVISYVTKYCLKCERNSTALTNVLQFVSKFAEDLTPI